MFQQDNASCHTARLVQDWFSENNITPLIWPARSPDLNPIENAWAMVDRKLASEPVTSIEGLKDRLHELWSSLRVEYCQKLFKSVRKRCLLCIKNKGGHIPY